MNNQINESLKNKFFNKLLSKEDNFICADCPNKGPTWASIGFGVFICLNCSGKHRSFGMHITRVKSIKLDNWTYDELTIMENLGNLIANNYYLYKNKLSKNNLDLKSKYINKINCPNKNIIEEPIKIYNKDKEHFQRSSYLNLNKINETNNINTNSNKREDFKIESKRSINLIDFSSEKITKNDNNNKNSNNDFEIYENKNNKEMDLIDLNYSSNYNNIPKKDINTNNLDNLILNNEKMNNNTNNQPKNINSHFNSNINTNNNTNINSNFNSNNNTNTGQNNINYNNRNNFDKYNILNSHPRNNFNQQKNINNQNNDKYAVFDYIRRF